MGCDPVETSYRDFLNATVNVKANDAVSPVANLPVDAYDWDINFKDGSTVLERLQDPRFVTGSDGAFTFTSEELCMLTTAITIIYRAMFQTLVRLTAKSRINTAQTR